METSWEGTMDVSDHVTLNNGVEMPLYGLGLSHNNGGFSRDAVLESLRHGVRLLDTAKRYGPCGPSRHAPTDPHTHRPAPRP